MLSCHMSNLRNTGNVMCVFLLLLIASMLDVDFCLNCTVVVLKLRITGPNVDLHKTAVWVGPMGKAL